MIGVIDMMLMIDQTKVPILQFHTVDIPNMPGIVADQSHIVGICTITVKYFLSIDCSSSVVNMLTTSLSVPLPSEPLF